MRTTLISIVTVVMVCGWQAFAHSGWRTFPSRSISWTPLRWPVNDRPYRDSQGSAARDRSPALWRSPRARVPARGVASRSIPLAPFSASSLSNRTCAAEFYPDRLMGVGAHGAAGEDRAGGDHADGRNRSGYSTSQRYGLEGDGTGRRRRPRRERDQRDDPKRLPDGGMGRNCNGDRRSKTVVHCQVEGRRSARQIIGVARVLGRDGMRTGGERHRQGCVTEAVDRG